MGPACRMHDYSFSGRFNEISYFLPFHFTLCCAWKEEEDIKFMLSKRKKKKPGNP